MTRIQCSGVAAAILLLLASAAFTNPQANASPPLTCENVNGFLKAEKSGTFAPGYTRGKIEQLGIDFQGDSPCGVELLKSDPSFRDIFPRYVKITDLTVQCELVECEVTINNEVAGTTVASILTKAHVKPGVVAIKVSARGFETQTREVTVAPGEHSRPKFRMEPLKGSLAVTCQPTAPVIADPLDCGITIIGPNGFSKKGVTTAGRFTLDGLPSGEYDIEASAPPCYVPATVKTWVAAPDVRNQPLKLEPDEWGCKTDLQVFDALLGSLGGKAVTSAGAVSKNTALMRLAGDPPSIGMWNGVQVTEYVAPNRLRWDMTIAATKWNVIFDGTKVGSSGDKNRYAGKEFAQELEYSIRLFSTMRLPQVLSRILAKFDIKKGSKLVLIADSPDERFTFHLKEDYSPSKVVYERLTAPRSKHEMEFEQFKPVGEDLILPHVVILRYPDRPKHEHIFEYDKIDISPQGKAQIKEDVFKVPK